MPLERHVDQSIASDRSDGEQRTADRCPARAREAATHRQTRQTAGPISPRRGPAPHDRSPCRRPRVPAAYQAAVPAINTLSFRLEQTFEVPRVRGKVGIFADVFNLWNQGAPNSDVTNAVRCLASRQRGLIRAWCARECVSASEMPHR